MGFLKGAVTLPRIFFNFALENEPFSTLRMENVYKLIKKCNNLTMYHVGPILLSLSCCSDCFIVLAYMDLLTITEHAVA